MTEKDTILMVLTSCPDQGTATQLGQELVRDRLAACINIIPEVFSCFIWQGKLEDLKEVLLLIKTTRRQYPKLEARLQALHPYELPEIIAIPVEEGLAAYLDWVRQGSQV